MTSAQLAGLLATVGAAFLAQSIACALLVRQVRRLAARAASAPPATASDAAQIRAIEARLARLEARATARGSGPGSPPSSPEAKRLRRLDRRQVASADGPVLIAVPSLAVPPASSSTAEAAAELGRRFGGIWALADAGVPDDEIALRTGFPVGQVELILGLRRPRPGGDPAPSDGPDRGDHHA